MQNCLSFYLFFLEKEGEPAENSFFFSSSPFCFLDFQKVFSHFENRAVGKSLGKC